MSETQAPFKTQRCCRDMYVKIDQRSSVLCAFLSEIQVQIKNPDGEDFSTKETMYPKMDHVYETNPPNQRYSGKN